MNNNQVVYFDNNATTKIYPGAVEKMLPYLKENYGNPSSLHRFGQQNRPAIDNARKQISKLLNCRASLITFTSGATESINTILRGVLPYRGGKKKIITSRVEHPATFCTLDLLSKLQGMEIVKISVDSNGNLDLDELYREADENTAIVTLMWANNETGVIFPIEEIAQELDKKGIPFHVDAAQGVGKVPINLKNSKISALSFSGHKFHGPKGIGGFYVKRGFHFHPLLCGGGQESGIRSGTENIAFIVGIGEAANHCMEHMKNNHKMAALRDYLEEKVLELVPECIVNGKKADRLPNTANICFKNASGEALLQLLDEVGIAVSTTSACHSNDQEPSHVLSAMGISPNYVRGALRISLSHDSNKREVDFFLEQISRAAEHSRTNSPALY